MNRQENNKEIVRKFITEALPTNNVDYVRQVVSKDAVTHRAGFAALYAATGDAIPKKGNFLDWMTAGWAVLHGALSDQKVEMKHVVAEGNKVIAQFHYYVTHKGTFVGMPATNKRIEWDEVGIFEFNDDGQITDMWYMCEEIKLAMEIGFKLEK
ncbi:ester cyclase [Bacillus toyonensis]|uniref:ester cyclase n=1 Tax=Bacillus toyonensis TaxID=155322 RepID=UPI0036E4E407